MRNPYRFLILCNNEKPVPVSHIMGFCVECLWLVHFWVECLWFRHFCVECLWFRNHKHSTQKCLNHKHSTQKCTNHKHSTQKPIIWETGTGFSLLHNMRNRYGFLILWIFVWSICGFDINEKPVRVFHCYQNHKHSTQKSIIWETGTGFSLLHNMRNRYGFLIVT